MKVEISRDRRGVDGLLSGLEEMVETLIEEKLADRMQNLEPPKRRERRTRAMSLLKRSFAVSFSHQSFDGLFSPETEQCFSKEYVRADADKKQSKYSIREFVAERPLPDVEYFGKYAENSMSRGLTVVIPFYNEETLAITETLKDVNTNISMLRKLPNWRDKPVDIVAIGDGWGKMDRSVKDMLQTLFPPDPENANDWPEWLDLRLEQMQALKKRGKQYERRTFIFEQSRSYYIDEDSGKLRDYKFTLSFIIKIDNRRKHNSHEWFFSAFVPSKMPAFMFLTDAFTKFQPDTLMNLISTMQRDNRISVSTGRQRVMSKFQQRQEDEMLFSMSDWLRRVQCFDFESSNCVYNGAFALAGFLPVVPGPCGLFRYDHMCTPGVGTGKNPDGTDRTPVEWYLHVINTPAEKTGWIQGNLKLAEDRVLSYAAVLKTKRPAFMSFVTSAVFFFESEGKLSMLIKQRRRWINGTVAGYIWLLSELWGKSSLSIFRFIYIYTLILIQLITYIGAFFGPALIFSCLHWSFNYVGEALLHYDNYDSDIANSITLIMWFIWVLHIVHHSGKDSYNGLLFFTLIFLGAFTVACGATSFIHFYTTRDEPIHSPFTILENKEFDEYDACFWIITANFFLPLFCSVFLSMFGSSTKLMLLSMLHFYFFLPTLTAWMTSYSFCRTWDLSWGNRPTENEFDHLSSHDKAVKREEIQQKADCLTLFMLILNISLFCCPTKVLLIFTFVIFGFVFFEVFLSLIYLVTYGCCFRGARYGWCCLWLRRGALRSTAMTAKRTSVNDELLLPETGSVAGSMHGSIHSSALE